MIIICYILSTPLLFASKVVRFFNFFNFQDELILCLKTINLKKNEVPENFVAYLVAAEDHRFAVHCGIDPIGILRASYMLLIKNKLQGASTIEQQFVRVVTNNYENSIVRKFKEQILAIELSRIIKKKDIATAYLAIAYYGYSYQSINKILNLSGKKLEQASESEKISIVARLKYPEPSKASINWYNWKKNHTARMQYIKYMYTFKAYKI